MTRSPCAELPSCAMHTIIPSSIKNRFLYSIITASQLSNIILDFYVSQRLIWLEKLQILRYSLPHGWDQWSVQNLRRDKRYECRWWSWRIRSSRKIRSGTYCWYPFPRNEQSLSIQARETDSVSEIWWTRWSCWQTARVYPDWAAKTFSRAALLPYSVLSHGMMLIVSTMLRNLNLRKLMGGSKLLQTTANWSKTPW